MKLRSALALAALLATTALAHADSVPTAVGFWETKYDDGSPQGWFLVTEKNEVYSARLVKGFKEAGNDKPPQMLCTDCPGKKKGAHIMGLTLFYGLKRDGLTYQGGSVLDPRDGTVYHALMDLDADGKVLHVRGYLGIPLMGKTTDWYRLPDDAMKKEEIPKEILAGDDDKKPHGDPADKKAHADADKVKPHKAKAKPADQAEPTPVASPEPEKTPE